jgi:predicted ABC-type ATPase
VSEPPGPVLTIVAGPNGAGKSTFTDALSLHGTAPVLDVDAIARRLHPDAPERAAIAAGREMLRRETAYLGNGTSFAVETTLAGTSVLHLMERARARAFSVHLIYIGVDDVATLLGRIAQRVARGGHDVAEPDVRRRYTRSLSNLSLAVDRANRVQIIDNSSDQGPIEVLMLEQGQIRRRSDITPRWVTIALSPILSADA